MTFTDRFCVICNSPLIELGARKYCSYECRDIADKQNRTLQAQRYQNRKKLGNVQKLKTVSCDFCKTDFLQRSTTQIFCSDSCRIETYAIKNQYRNSLLSKYQLREIKDGVK